MQLKMHCCSAAVPLQFGRGCQSFQAVHLATYNLNSIFPDVTSLVRFLPLNQKRTASRASFSTMALGLSEDVVPVRIFQSVSH